MLYPQNAEMLVELGALAYWGENGDFPSLVGAGDELESNRFLVVARSTS
jgi:hypothetical protein